MISKMLYWFSRPVVRTYTGAMLQMNVMLHEKLPRGPKIIAANHPSTTDPFFVAAMTRQQVYIMINDLLFQVPFLGTYLRRSGHIPVKSGNGSLKVALERLAEGKTIIIFPEGNLSPIEGGFLAPRSGVARLALASGAPVIPVGIHLNRSLIRPIRSTVKGQVEYGYWYLSGPYHMTAGYPLYLKGDPENRPYVKNVAENIMHHIIEMVHQSEQRMNQGPTPLVSLPVTR